ncbi:hypothetical protein D3C72_2053250 [compost metagenome]
MAVDVLEGVLDAVARRHQLDHAARRMAGQACGLVEGMPAQEVLPDLLGHLHDGGLHADGGHQAGHVVGV